MSRVEEIRAEHERLSAIVSTQSVRIVNELRSDAHKHRGVLLAEVDRLRGELEARELQISELRSEIAAFWSDAPKSAQRAYIASS